VEDDSRGGIVLKGGSWYDSIDLAPCYFQYRKNPDKRANNIGFRLVE